MSVSVNTGDPFYGIQGTYVWVLDIMDNNANLDLKAILRRIWFFPFSWIIAVGIPTGYIILKTIIEGYKKKPKNKLFILLSIPFFIMFLFFEYNTFKGVLLTQHRFTGTLVILSLPFIARYFNDLSPKKIKLVWFFSFLTIGLSFIYNTAHVKPLPRLKDQSAVKISEIIKENTGNESCIILDFVGWDNTYFIALQSRLPQEKIVICEGATNSILPLQEIDKKITHYNNGILLLKKGSELTSNLNLDSYPLKTKEIYNKGEIILLRWDK